MKISLPATLLLVLLGLAPATGARLGAQGTTLVPPSDLAYGDIERLAVLGALDAEIIGQRPFSRRAIARMVRDAGERVRRQLGRGEDDDARWREAAALVERLEERFGPWDLDPVTGGVYSPFEGGSLSFSSNTEIREPLTGLSRAVEATLGSFGGERSGKPAERGRTLALELAQRMEPLPWLSVAARERLESRAAHDSGVAWTDGEVLLATVRARLGNAAFTAGRSPLAWSQLAEDGLIFASDAPAVDQASLASEEPFRLPGVLRRVGPMRGTLVYALLGASRVRSGSRLVAYKLSAAPSATTEIGASFADHFGGSGSRPASVGNRVVDLLPFVDVFRRHNYADSTSELETESDKLLGVDGRVRLARLAGLVLSGELVVDDFDIHRLPTLVRWDGSQTVRAILPQLINGAWSLDLSAKHTGVRAYGHHQLTNGFATRGRLLGDQLGNDAKAFAAAVVWDPSAGTRLRIEARTAIRSSADYAYQASGTSFALVRLGDASNELRDRLLGSLTTQPSGVVAIVIRMGAERTRNAAFEGRTRRDYLADVSLQVLR